MNEPLVSIIVPVFNAARWLAETLDSALAQTWPNVEVIVVDDGSRDESIAIARRYASPRVKVVTQENAGASAARNRALDHAQGDYLQYLDADDLLAPDKIEAQLRTLASAGPRHLATCPAYYFNDGAPRASGAKVDGWPMTDADDPVEWLVELYLTSTWVPPACWLVPRAVADAAGRWDEKCTTDNDGEYFCRVVLACNGIRSARDTHTFYRVVGARSLSRQRTTRHILGGMYAQDRKAQHLLARRNDEQAREAVARCYLSRAAAAFPHSREACDYALARAKSVFPDIGLRGKAELIRRVFGWDAAFHCIAWNARLRGRPL